MYKIVCNSEFQTKEYAKKLAENLKCGDVLVLSGELGAGKTKFVEGLLNYFDLQDEISSPTYTIVNEYKNDKINIYHFDLYRLGDIYEFENIGGEEYFSKGICIFEWGELIEDILPDEYLHIELKYKDMSREMILNPVGEKYEKIVEELTK